MKADEEPKCCPICSKGPIARVLYGLPHFSRGLKKALKEGRVTLGGCLIDTNPPHWECTQCGHKF